MKLYIKNVEGLVIPTRKTKYSAGYDVQAATEPRICRSEEDGYFIEYGTNLYFEPLDLEKWAIIGLARSSISKYNLVLANCFPLIDADYRGQVMFRFKYIPPVESLRIEDGRIVYDIERIYQKGDAIAQIMAYRREGIDFILAEELQSTERGAGGFGSTGK